MTKVLDAVKRDFAPLLLSAVLAQWGGIAFEYSFRKIARWFFPTHSNRMLVVTDIVFALLAAAIIAVIVHLSWKTSAAQWAWLVSGLWIVYGVASYLALPQESVMIQKSFWPHFSGLNCASSGGSEACYDFFIFTVPLLRGISYSVASWLLFRNRRHPSS